MIGLQTRKLPLSFNHKRGALVSPPSSVAVSDQVGNEQDAAQSN